MSTLEFGSPSPPVAQAKRIKTSFKKIGLLCPREGHIMQYKRWLKQYGQVVLVSEDEQRSDLSILVLPDSDNAVDTSSAAFMVDTVPLVERSYDIICPIYAQFGAYQYDLYKKAEIPMFGIGNGALFLAAKLGCKLMPHVPFHRNVWHKVVDYNTKAITNVFSSHTQGISVLSDNLRVFANAANKNGDASIIEAFNNDGSSMGGVLWHPHLIENGLDSVEYLETKRIFGDSISDKLLKSLLKNV